MKKRFTALRMLSVLAKIAAVLAVPGSPLLAFAVGTLFGNSAVYDPEFRLTVPIFVWNNAIAAGIFTLIGGWIGALCLFAGAHLIDLLLALETHQRASVILLRRMLTQLGYEDVEE